MLDPVTVSASTRLFYVTRDTARVGSRDQYTHKSEPLRSMAISQTSSSYLLRCEMFHGRSPEVSACLARGEQTPADGSFHGEAAHALLYPCVPC